MTAIRLGTFLLMATLATAQQTSVSKSAKSSLPEPKLPVIDYNACPGKDHIVSHFRIVKDDRIYSSWQDKRVPVGMLKAGNEATVLAGVNVIREPDRAVVRQLGADAHPFLKAGDVVLRYGFHWDGESDFWGKGVWFTVNFEDIEEKDSFCGFGKDQCAIKITKNGVSEWWVQVKTDSDLTGWVLAYNFAGDKNSRSGNFGDLCSAD
jgi:hypothetical protein